MGLLFAQRYTEQQIGRRSAECNLRDSSMQKSQNLRSTKKIQNSRSKALQIDDDPDQVQKLPAKPYDGHS